MVKSSRFLIGVMRRRRDTRGGVLLERSVVVENPLTVVAAGLLAALVAGAGGQEPDTLTVRNETAVGTVVLVRDADEVDEFEEGVLGVLKTKLEARGYGVRLVELAELKKLEAREYVALVILNAAKADGLRKPVRTFMKRAAGEKVEERVLISTVLGEERGERKPQVHARSGATSTYSTTVVVASILERVEAILEAGENTETPAP
jgi:hypothetical protein